MNKPSPSGQALSRGRPERIRICEGGGERMDERPCQIVYGNCGYTRDCSGP